MQLLIQSTPQTVPPIAYVLYKGQFDLCSIHWTFETPGPTGHQTQGLTRGSPPHLLYKRGSEPRVKPEIWAQDMSVYWNFGKP
jgi:hypothetical protein